MDEKIVKDVLDAIVAGVIAGRGTTPEEMIVRDASTGQTWNVPEGPCGFAWVEFKGNTKFARVVKQMFEGNRNEFVMYGNAYPTGKHLWITAFGQSYDRKSTMAGAMARLLNERGYADVYAGGRLD